MSSDRELLEKAARAAGLVAHDVSSRGLWVYSVDPELNWDGQYPIFDWNPLTDDGDALRLASKLRLLVDFSSCCAMNLRSADDDWFGGLPGDERIGCSPAEFDGPAVVRRAIVRAAAALGEQHDQ